MTNQYRFTLSHSSGSQGISEPIGWQEISLVLDRDTQYFSLMELFEASFVFYGSNGTHDGGKDFIESILEDYGPDEDISLTVELLIDEVADDIIYTGLLNLEGHKIIDGTKLRCGVMRDDLWSRFVNRENTPVDIQSSIGIDGESVTPAEAVTVRMSGQIIQYYGEYRWKESFAYPESDEGAYLNLDWDQTVTDDIKKITIPRARTGFYSIGSLLYTNATPQFEAPYDGDYLFDIKITGATVLAGEYVHQDLAFRIHRANEHGGSSNFTKVITAYGVHDITVHSFYGIITLTKGQQVVMYGEEADDTQIFGEERLTWLTDAALATTSAIILSGEQVIDGELTASSRVLVKDQGDPAQNGVYDSSAGAWTRVTEADTAIELTNVAVYVTGGSQNIDTAWKNTDTVTVIDSDPVNWQFTFDSFERQIPFPGTTVENYVKVTALTTFPETESEGFLIHDVAGAILDRITTPDRFYSEYFGSPLTNYRQYENEGCAWNYAAFKGLHIRGYTLSEKKHFESFRGFWGGANPLFNLGLGYEEINGLQCIRVEHKSYFFDPDPVVNLSWVNNIEESQDKDHQFKKITVGYNKWQAEDVSGIDDPQTKSIFATLFKNIGIEISIVSEWIAASLAIESTRRKTIEKRTDYKFDNDTFIIALNPEPDGSPTVFTPELDENFESVSSLSNSDTRYNLFLTPLRNFHRWLTYFNGCLQKYLSSSYKFVSGEGNYDLTTDYNCTSGIKKDCEGTACGSVSESGIVPVTVDYLFSPVLWEFEHPLTWDDYKLIRDNRTKAIGVSTSETEHATCFIKRLVFDVNSSKGKFVVWKR
jgi:hypothetical protein